jgi:RNA polymerase sigma-70 factor (ECF subfamily)
MQKQEIEILFKTHYTRMYRLAASILYDEEESKDVVSEVFCRLLTKDITLRPETAESYLLMSVRNQCLNVLERKQVRERFVKLISEEAVRPTLADSEKQRMAELMEYVEGNLPEMSRQIIRLRYLRDMSCQEVADTLGVSRQTVHSYLRQAIESIRAFFKSKDY